MGRRVKVRDNNNIPNVLSIIEELNSKKLEIGIFGDDDGDMVKIASVHEFGATINRKGSRKDGTSYSFQINIPERSFLRSTFDNEVDDMTDLMQQLIERRVLTGRMSVDAFYQAIGEELVSRIRRTIRNLDTPPNAESTIKKKRSSSPLIDDGHLRRSITWRVVDK
ncbi:hypothetical protein [Desertibacillus haloalkaliphilus]|uniref:hypothetical protein n=1 Tax=Desertibacillus haloalkaliphilus TaxID=1328930 RepID=UPI001C26527E|nr:hypothetical protein [Desertibacillus haloalkaliphilus]MBU8908508.1 hypothetical protein [Desertibacillus haloalkaliphilus]